MRFVVLVALLVTASMAVSAQGNVQVPWEEFKALYQANLEREMEDRFALPAPEPPLLSIDTAQYTLEVQEGMALGTAILEGRVLAGAPDPIPLFSSDLAITALEQVSGGTIISARGEDGPSFLPDTGAATFQMVLRFATQPQGENATRNIAFAIPSAVQNTLQVTLPPQHRLVTAPGFADKQGRRHFAGTSKLAISYVDTRREKPAPVVVEVDTFSRIRLQKNRFLIETAFLPVRELPRALRLQAPAEAKLIGTSLRPAQVTAGDGGIYTITPAPGGKAQFNITFAIPFPEEERLTFLLPCLLDNTGRQGRFAVEQPDSGEVMVTAEGLVPSIPRKNLGAMAKSAVFQGAAYMHVPANTLLTVCIDRFQPVSAPRTVLSSQYLFTSFEESGKILSVLVMDLPPALGPRMTLKAVPGADIWAFTVNGAHREVYSDKNQQWILPLDPNGPSHIELAFLREGPKLGLHGRLEVALPETGLPAQEVRVGIALPPRVDLISLEGPVAPATGKEWECPSEFVGKPYYFTRSFFQGEGMDLAISYKEPVEPAGGRKGGLE